MEEQKITRREKIKVFFKKPRLSFKWMAIIILLIGLFIGGSVVVAMIGGTTFGNCSVAGIKLQGTLTTYIPKENGEESYYDTTASETVLDLIKNANENSDIKAIIISVDSVGGTPVAAEEINNAVRNSEKPVFAYMREMGNSGAYYSISGADRIWAAKNSNVGGIGVTMSYLSNVEKNEKEGYTYEQISAGKFKDTGSPDKFLTNEERALLLRDTIGVYENFVKAVSENRKLSIEEVRKTADGSTVLGEKAKELGLIDEIGGQYEVEKYIEGQLGEKPEICWE